MSSPLVDFAVKSKTPHLDAYGHTGVTLTQFMLWVESFVLLHETPAMYCGLWAHAAIWNLTHYHTHGWYFDLKEPELLRTGYGAIKLHLNKQMEPGSIRVLGDFLGEPIATAENLQVILH